MVMRLEELNVYTISMAIAEKVWQIVLNWDYFAKDTIGKQVVRSSDSIAANISEGFGRYHFKDSKHFLYYSRGSLYETQTWLTKAYKRNLIDNDTYNQLILELKELAIKLNNYINSIGKHQSS
jgi:four helix bundle protein